MSPHWRAHRTILAMRIFLLALMLVLAGCGRSGVEGGGVSREPGSSTAHPTGSTRTGEPASGRPADRGNAAPATAGGGGSRVELFDAHIHYSQDAWVLYTPEQAIEILRDAGIRRALVSSTPDAGTQRLYALAPDLVVPILRPYRTRGDIGPWTRDPTVVAYVESTYRRGIHRGIGEFHLVPGDAATPVVRAIVAMAIREDLWLHAHADEHAIAELARSDRRAKVLWAHAGLSSTVEAVRGVLDAHPNVVAELALRSDVMWGQVIDPAWREVLVRYPDRFMVGTDTWTPSRWEDVAAGHERTRAWLAQLPADVAARIARGNAERLFGEPR